jgi:hypothetical protein
MNPYPDSEHSRWHPNTSYSALEESITNDILIEHFSLQTDDFDLLKRVRQDSSRLGFTVLLKTLEFLGFPPQEKSVIPAIIVKHIGNQLGLDVELFKQYTWKNRAWDQHISIIREHTGYRPFDADDVIVLSNQLVEEANESPSRKELFDIAVYKCRERRIELPSEKELQRIVNSARSNFFSNVYQTISDRISPEIRNRMTACFQPDESDTASYDWIKTKAGRLGINNLLEEINKLNSIRKFQIEPDVLFNGISQVVLRQLRDRALPEDSYLMRRHPDQIRYTMMSVLLHFRQQEVTDNIIRSFLELIRRIEKKADKSLETKLIKNIRKIYGKSNILYKIAKVSTENPEGTIQDVIFKAIDVDVLKRIVDEFDAESEEANYDSSKTKS